MNPWGGAGEEWTEGPVGAQVGSDSGGDESLEERLLHMKQWSEALETCIQILALPGTCSMTGQLFSVFKLHMWNQDNNNVYLMGLSWSFSEMVHIFILSAGPARGMSRKISVINIIVKSQQRSARLRRRGWKFQTEGEKPSVVCRVSSFRSLQYGRKKSEWGEKMRLKQMQKPGPGGPCAKLGIWTLL